ncbi:CC033 protein, partial [Atractosteus spatula]|nr:CC033 protein [Atractosteus spatula]
MPEERLAAADEHDEPDGGSKRTSNIVAKISQIADDHLTVVRNISTGLAIAGIIVLARSIKLITKFGAAADIPARFIEKNVSLRGKIHHVKDNRIELEHVPITVPGISPLLRERQSKALLVVRLAGVELTENGQMWLKQQLKPAEVVWFKLIRRESNALDCLVFVNRGGLFRDVCLNEELLRQGLGRTVPAAGLPHGSRLFWRVHRRLLRAEGKAEKAGRGLWKRRTLWEQMLDSLDRFKITGLLKRLLKRT